FTHWVVYNIPKDVRQLSGAVLKAATEDVPYQGPNPPKGEKAHTYVFTLYALNTDKLTLAEGVPVTAEAMRTAMQGRTIGRPAEVGVTFGYYRLTPGRTYSRRPARRACPSRRGPPGRRRCLPPRPRAAHGLRHTRLAGRAGTDRGRLRDRPGG